ncbi:uncharacterized protein LOC111411237 [Olea europaea var. sylvestris]|uniref:uncharacterized protein LOC111411237 n=1 Tax=Olea europaea var. sylvestris TaxID=158386 RepID=UPI000C1D452A|nr:uncharacterized protein LOC111411237 [Olea europaea var. sylvestris]
MRSAICEYKKENSTISQKDMQAWVQQKFDLTTSKSTISNTLKRTLKYLSNQRKNSDVKRHKSAKYPDLEKVFFSSGWLERFKARYGIKSYRRFGESGSVIMENIENALLGIRSKLVD